MYDVDTNIIAHNKLNIKPVHTLPLLIIAIPKTDAIEEKHVENANKISGITLLNPFPYAFVIKVLKHNIISANTNVVIKLSIRLYFRALLKSFLVLSDVLLESIGRTMLLSADGINNIMIFHWSAIS